jgi:hypothetical protein
MRVEDGTGTGYNLKIDSNNRAHVLSKSEPVQYTVSKEDGQAYQVIGTATLASGTVTALHIKNTSETKRLVVNFIRHQVIGPAGGTTLPNASNYFKIALGRTYDSGGTSVVPVNVNQESGNAADVLVYNNAPTLTGTALEIDRWYTKAEADMNAFDKDGVVILGPQRTLELSYVGDQTSGTIYTRLSFLMEDV